MTAQFDNPEIEFKARAHALLQELGPIFSETHSIGGHGTMTKENAEGIMRDGLYAKAPALSATTLSLENSIQGMKQILKWPHAETKYVVVIMIPKEASGSRGTVTPDEHLWEDVAEDDSRGYTSSAKLPSKYVRGYIDVNGGKFVSNPNFEEHPDMPEPIVAENALARRTRNATKGPVPVPAPGSEETTVKPEDTW